MEVIRKKFEALTPYKKAAVIITSFLVATPSIGTVAYHIADLFIDQKYVSHVELKISESYIIKSIREIEMREIQEDILAIDDKEIDGTITNADKKKRLRLREDLKCFN